MEARIQEFLRQHLEAEVANQVKVDPNLIIQQYKQVQEHLDKLTPHQRQKLEEWVDNNSVRIFGPAGSGKTYIAMHKILEMIKQILKEGQSARHILIAAQNPALTFTMAKWIFFAIKKDHKRPGRFLSVRVGPNPTGSTKNELYILFGGSKKTSGSTIHKVTFVKAKDGSHSIELAAVPGNKAPFFDMVVVDEAHHVFSANSDLDPKLLKTHIQSRKARSQAKVDGTPVQMLILLSDASQVGATDSDIKFPKVDQIINLVEIIRNSQRIIGGSLGYLSVNDGAHSYFNHADATSLEMTDMLGPPIRPYMISQPFKTQTERMATYAQIIHRALYELKEAYPGVEIHRKFAVIVPTTAFRNALVEALKVDRQHSKYCTEKDKFYPRYLSALQFAQQIEETPRNGADDVVVSTMKAYDGLETLGVLCVGMDSVKDGSLTCCQIYRAMTRAHLFLVIIQVQLLCRPCVQPPLFWKLPRVLPGSWQVSQNQRN